MEIEIIKNITNVADYSPSFLVPHMRIFNQTEHHNSYTNYIHTRISSLEKSVFIDSTFSEIIKGYVTTYGCKNNAGVWKWRHHKK